MNEHPPSRGVLTPEEISILLKEELSLELGLATAGYFDADRDDAELARSHRIYSEAYSIAARNGGEYEVSDEERRRLERASWAARDIRAVELILKHYCSTEKGEIERRLSDLGLMPTPSLVRQARVQLLRARAEAQNRAALIPTAEVAAQFDPVNYLLNMTSAESAPIHPLASAYVRRSEPTPDRENADCPFVSNDRRNLSAIASEICDGLITDKIWRDPAIQQKRIVNSFIWITGDKPIGDYRQDDAADFKRKLQRLSTKFRWLHKPGVQFSEILADLPDVDEKTRRNPKTVNRDLSTMSTFYEAMRKAGPWSTADDRTRVLNFAKLQDPVEDDEDAPTRVPWQESHLRLLFGSPIFHGNQGAKKRLVEGSTLLQDAAYWAPILLYWTLATRGEVCGLELEDIFLDEPIPYIYIRKNSTRDLKRKARGRRIPIAHEPLRLRFDEYVRALKADGEKHLFPELYRNKAKIGGAQFYAIVWVYLINWLSDRSDIPATEGGKEADVHSMRTFGSSVMDVSAQVNQNIVKDIMGHARQGVTSRSYQKRKLVVGEVATLAQMLEVIERYLPVVTLSVPAASLMLLPTTQRSRCGSSRPRKIRQARV